MPKLAAISPEVLASIEAAVAATLRVNEERTSRGRAAAHGAATLASWSTDRRAAKTFLASSTFLNRRTNEKVTAASAAQVQDLILNAVVEGNDLVPDARPHVGLLPTKGGRIASRTTVLTIGAEIVSAAREISSTEAAAPTAYGTSLPEATLAFDGLHPDFDRVGSFINVDRGVWEDKGEAEEVISAFIRRDVLRELDEYVLLRTDDGILDNEDVPTSARATRTRFASVVDAIAAVRNAGHLGVVSVCVNGTDAAALANEDGFKRDVLDLLGAELVISALVPDGSALVADLAAAATVWLREPGLTLALADSHGNGFLTGQHALRGTVRTFSRVQLPSAAHIVTDFDVDPS